VLVDRQPEVAVEVEEPLPMVEMEGGEEEEERWSGGATGFVSMEVEEEEEKEGERGTKEYEPKKEGLVTLSRLPRAHWQVKWQKFIRYHDDYY